MSPARTMPAVFFGHGSPMNAIERTRYSDAWRKIGESLPQPRAVLAVSAHWYTRGTLVTADEHPKTVHDFYGFPKALFDVQYPAPGDPKLAARVREVLAPVTVRPDRSWGLDHGTWSVLVHVYPHARVPVLQLSIDATQPPQFHYDLGRRLAALREEGVLVAGFGNVVHNLQAMRRMQGAAAFDWAARFESEVRRALVGGDDDALVNWERFGEDARLSVPTPEHYLPLLYVAGARRKGESVSVPVEGIDLGSISMLSAVVGAP
jgi:4,5-DOPA dioxygenase extradiol